MKKFVMFFIISALISACAEPQVEQAANPFAGDRQSAPIHKLSLALVLPALKVTKHGRDVPAKELRQENKDEPEKMYREVLGIYYQDFKSVTLVKDLRDPRAADADLLGSMDVDLVTNPSSLSVTNAFYGPDHGLVATVKTQASGPSYLFPRSAQTVFSNLVPQIPDRLDMELMGSTELKQYAKSSADKVAGQTQGRQESRAKTFDSDVDRPGYSFEENADNYAVVVGVENYQNLPAAEFAGRDARAVRAHLKALGYPGANIIMLTDAQATGNAVKSYVESWLPHNVKPDSKVFFYFSGHGAPDTDSKQAYLVPWDGDPQFLADTGYSLKRLYQKLNGLNAKEVIVAMDSCFSGAGGRSVLAKGARPLVTKVDEGNAADMGKVVVLAAAGAEEITGEEESQGHGLFTYYLLKSLNESAGKNNVGQVYSYLKPLVEDAARQSNRGQTPQILGGDVDQGAKESLR